MKTKQQKGTDKTKIMLMVVLVVFAIQAVWTIDLVISGYYSAFTICNSGSEITMTPILTNGFWNANPIQMYHIAIYELITIVLIFSALVIWEVMP